MILNKIVHRKIQCKYKFNAPKLWCSSLHCKRGLLLFILWFTWPQTHRKMASNHCINVKWAGLMGFFLNPQPGWMQCFIYQAKGDFTDRTNRKAPLELGSVLHTQLTNASISSHEANYSTWFPGLICLQKLHNTFSVTLSCYFI